ncbi:glycosyltransferase [Salipiger bermudensis]|uniref:glycosyltransferase n=1 Tax=Salipiger bermudensis TaxID=344736 RepID=UPI001C9919B9|nr:glycosyltransferase [Salipiger bermudensis]MBY6006630.1 glycosyltransferase [Salipiger bermudensis]
MPASDTPLISVIVPVYNVRDHVAACLASLRGQTLADFELLVIDDGSTDGSGALAAEAIAGDPRARLIRQQNRGLSGARNTGLEHARGTFIAFVDSDDRVSPDYLMRLWQALEESGADWVSCALRSVFPDGGSHVHSTIHDAPDLASHPVRRRFALRSWPEVIRHFPSAWNKLYRRSLIEGLRFDEGTWFEDHAFFYRAAARTDHLLYLPEPLYLQTRGRPGQITAADDDRAFQQIDVLRSLRPLFDEALKPQAGIGYSRIATRLLYERSTALREPARRARFAAAAAAFLQEQGLTFDAEWDPGIARSWALELAGELPLSLVIAWDGSVSGALSATLESLAAQHGPGREVLVACSGAESLRTASDLLQRHPDSRAFAAPAADIASRFEAGLGEARGRFVVFLQPGDLLRPVALHDWCDTMLATGAETGISQYRVGTGPDGHPHTGFELHPLPGGTPATGALEVDGHTALTLASELSARIFRRDLLQNPALGFTPGPRPHWALCLAAPLLAERCAYIAWDGVAVNTAPDSARGQPLSLRAFLRGHDALVRGLPAKLAAQLPEGWQRRLFARALRLQVDHGGMSRTMLAGVMLGAAQRGLTGPATAPAGFDSSFGPRLARLLNPRGFLGGPALLPHRAQDGDGAQRRHFFPLHEAGLFRFRADFETGPCANLSFLAADGVLCPFHLSLRQPEQIAVCNDRRSDGAWRAERRIPVALPHGGVEVTVEIRPPQVRVLIDGTEIVRLGRRSLLDRTGLSGLERISLLELEGGVLPVDLMPRPPGPELALGPRLQLRAARPAAGERLRVAHSGDALPLVPSPGLDDRPGLLAELSGRHWRGLAPEAPLRIIDDGDLPLLDLTRQDMAARIGRVTEAGVSAADSALVLLCLEHVRHGALQPLLSPLALSRLQRLAESFGLDDYLTETAPSTDTAPVAPARLDDAGIRIDAALARIADSQQSAPAPDPLALLREMALPADIRRGTFLALTDSFCRDGQSFEGLYGLARELGFEDYRPAQDIWTNSALLPYLLLSGGEETAIALLRGMVRPGPGWMLTPPLAWTLRHAATVEDMPAERKQALIRLAMLVISRRAADYWDRAHCRELTLAAVTLLLARPGDLRLQGRIERFCLKVYGLSRLFWEALETRAGDKTLPPALAAARQDFRVVADPGAPSGQRAAALARFSRAGCSDASRLAIEILGPAGLPLAPGEGPAPQALEHAPEGPDLAALRHMAFPGSAAVPPETGQLAASALPDLYPFVPQSPTLELQRAVARRASALLSGAQSGDDPDSLTTLLDDLAPLSGAEAGFLGLGLAVALIPALGDPAAQRLAEWLRARHAAMPAETRRQAAGAAALRGPLARLHQSGGPQAESLCDALRGEVPLPALSPAAPGLDASPLFDTLVVVFSCKPYLESRIPALRAGWLDLLAPLGIPYIVVTGDGDGQRDGDIVALDAPDDYEGLPQKTLAAIAWVQENTGFAHMLKIDDDCFVNVPLFFESLNYRKFDYYGRKLIRRPGSMDRLWHQEKSVSERGRLELDRSPEPASYADGGSGYALSRRAMEETLAAAQSPAGQQLIARSFMEDKMLGDLLALRGIHVACEDYRVAIRRRSHPGALPVSSWLNAFFPGPSAPLQLIHLDTHEDQALARTRLSDPALHPAKIWPSFQPPRLGYQSNALELFSPPETVTRAREAEIAVVAVMRNEMFMLPHFLDHYRRIGIESFLIADNGSDDGSREYLAAQPDVALFSVDTDYRQSHYGVAWQQAMMASFRRDRWSLVADADELLVWQDEPRQSLPDLLRQPEFREAEAVRLFMLDMYPKGPLEQADFTRGGPFAEAGYCDAEPFLTNTLARGPYSDAPIWTSALRHRLIPGSRGTLFVAQKLALLRYHPFMRLSDGLHFVGDARIAERELIFAHFKYNAAFREKARTEVARRQHFNDAEEYRKYLALASEGRSVIHDPDLSVPWTECAFVRRRLD